jgi:vancomycin permeability regulator SanA
VTPDAVIVIFGAAVRPDGQPSPTLRRRVEAAAAFGARHRAPLYIPTGAKGRWGASEASIMAELLRRFGVPDEAMVLEETGTDTLSSVLAVRAVLRARGLRGRVHAASSGYHLPRCVALLRLAGVRARPCPPPAFPAAEGTAIRAYRWAREAVALPVDVVLILWRRMVG